MKTPRCLAAPLTRIFLTPFLAIPLAGQAQTVDRTTGTEIGSPGPGSPALASSRLGMTVSPVAPEEKAGGNIVFVRGGDSIGANGRLEGLQPQVQYRISLVPPVSQPVSPGTPGPMPDKAADGSPAAGPPKAGPPISPTPAAGKPTAGSPVAGQPDAGAPDGNMKPGAPGAGMEGSPATRSRSRPSPAELAGKSGEDILADLGVVMSDSKGNANLNVVLVPESRLPGGLAGLEGRSVVVTRVATASEPAVTVATGRIPALANAANTPRQEPATPQETASKEKR